MCVMAAGFSAVFGTLVAGAVFAMEVINIGRTKYKAVIPCLFASNIAHIVCISVGIHRTIYSITNTDSGDSLIHLFAGLGCIAVFAGATNTTLACTIKGIELFGTQNIIYYAVACFVAYYFSGHTGIFTSQKNDGIKMGKEDENKTLINET